jgi:hypothetical protein
MTEQRPTSSGAPVAELRQRWAGEVRAYVRLMLQGLAGSRELGLEIAPSPAVTRNRRETSCAPRRRTTSSSRARIQSSSKCFPMTRRSPAP